MKPTYENHPNFSKIPKILFWDTDFDKIDWDLKYIAVIKRIFERGDEEAKNEIIEFYGETKIRSALSTKSTKPMQLYINK